jgi:hypothetical protein
MQQRDTSAAVLLLSRLLSALIAALALQQAMERNMEWLSVTSLILLVMVLLPSVLVDLINRLTPIQVGPLRADRVPLPPKGPPDEWLRKTQEEIDKRFEDLKRDRWYIFLPEIERELYAQVVALTIRMTAVEEEIVAIRKAVR